VIAKVLMRGIVWLVLALQAMRDLRGQTAQGLAAASTRYQSPRVSSGLENTVYMEILK
jgi:hypothetical protein